MKKLIFVFFAILLSVVFVSAQTRGSIAGTVADSNGAVVPNATVTIKGESGEEFTATTSENGTFRVPAVPNGLYTVTIAGAGFKRAVFTNVKVDVGLPTTVDAALEVGDVAQVVEVTTGGEVLQTQTATIGTSIQGRQITETPIASRDALDLVGLLPGTASVGAPRRSSVNGLPKGSLTITIDGVDVQDNVLRSSDGYFTYVRPRIDAIEEVTVSTANPGAEAGGDGAVQIKFVTRRGTNDYNGGVFWQHRNTALNAAYWYNNRDLKPVAIAGNPNLFIPDYRNKVRLNQYGGRYGGKLPFPHFGEGGPRFHSGKDTSFFFVNWEEFRQPESQSRTRVVLTQQAQAGNYRYINAIPSNGILPSICTAISTTQMQCSQNVFNVAAANGQISTIDPTISAMLARIRTATATTGSITPITNSPNTENYNFTPLGGQVRRFLATRFDVNVTKDHSVEFVMNRQRFVPSKDFLNGQEERFPGFNAYTQGSFRNSYSTAVRSSFGKSVVNEVRYAISTGLSEFSPGISASDFGFSNGLVLDIGAAGATTPYSRNSYSNRNTPTYDLTNSTTWIKGNHNINFGGQFKTIRSFSSSIGRIVPTVSFGIDATEGTIFSMFNATNFPTASTTQQNAARALYATLIGHVIGYATTAYLTADGSYKENASQSRESKQYTFGLFAQDSWRIKQNLTVNYGVRWQPQTAFIIMSGNYSKLISNDMVYGVSGKGNIFKPGTLTGTAPQVIGVEVGEKAYPDDMNNFAPSVGVVWSPEFSSGFLKKIMGESGKSVFRGGYSISYVREGFDLLGSIYGSNPGGTLSASRSTTIANSLTLGTNLRDGNNPNLRALPFSATPSYPITLTTADSANAFSDDLKTGSIHSFSFGYQREIDRNTVVEFRYVGNRGVGLQRQYNLNEFNTIENGFAAEYKLAQANLYFNLANGKGATFAFTGAGTSPLPIAMAYIGGTLNPSLTTSYTNALWTNSTLINNLSQLAPSVIGWASNIEGNATRRANAITAGLPSNFVYVNPANPANSYIVDNSSKTWYDSGVIEMRRRLSDGLRVQANYVWSKAQANAYASSSVVFAGFTQRPGGLDLARNVQTFDIRHQFKFDATYDIPIGKGRKIAGGSGKWLNALIGGWSILPTIRWQTGSPFAFGNVQLVGMTKEELQKEIKVRKKDSTATFMPNTVTFLPDDIILNTQRAFDINGTAYGTTYGGAPTGRFIAPAGFGNCQSRFVGECGFNNLIVYGPAFFKFDATLAKKISLGERRNVELKATFLDVLNRPNFRVGGWGSDTVTSGVGGATFGQLATGSAYQDISTTNDPGGRLIDLMIRFNF